MNAICSVDDIVADLHKLEGSIQRSVNEYDLTAIIVGLSCLWSDYLDEHEGDSFEPDAFETLRISAAGIHHAVNDRVQVFNSRVGVTGSGFSRNLLGRTLPGVRLVPVNVRKEIGKLAPVMVPRVLAVVEQTYSLPIGTKFLSKCVLTASQRWKIVDTFLAQAIASAPLTILHLPEDVRSLLLAEAVEFPKFEPTDEFVVTRCEGRTPIVIDMVKANVDSLRGRNRAIASAVISSRTAPLKEAAEILKRELVFLSATERRRMPNKDWYAFSYDLNLRSILREAGKGSILHEESRLAVFKAAADGGCYVAKFLRGNPLQRVAHPDDSEYDVRPLSATILNWSGVREGKEFRHLRDTLDMVNRLRSKLAVERASSQMAERIARVVGHATDVAPEAMFTAAAYLIVAEGLGFKEAPMLATLEGFVHMLIKTATRSLRS
jgi:hypothetical protein